MRRALLPVLIAAGAIMVACADDGPGADARRAVGSASSSDATVSAPPNDAPATTMSAGSPPPVTDPAPQPVAPNGLSVRVQSLDNTFRPEVLEISAGTEVVWTNDGRVDHDVIASDGADWGVVADLFAPGDEYRHVFTLPGEYPYFCSIHGTADFGMIGTVIVTG